MKLIFQIVFMLLPSYAFSQIIVGNAGDGILKDGHIYLLDLYESNSHLNPYVGNNVSQDVQTRLPALTGLNGLGIDQDILLKKLTDAQLIKAGLGTFLIDAIASYNWKMIPDLHLDDEDSPLVPNVQRVPLAKRYRNTVYIHQANFQSLSPVHKVALILHEALYSFVRTEGADCERQVCKQPAINVRAINGFLFGSQAASCPLTAIGNCLNSNLAATLNIPWNIGWEASDRSYMRAERATNEVLYDSRYALKNSGPLNFEQQIFDFAQNVCEKIGGPGYTSTGNPSEFISIEMFRRPYIFQMFPYRANNSSVIDNTQYAARIIERDQQCFTVARYASKIDCIFILNKAARAWFDDTASGLHQAMPSCTGQ